VRPGEGRFSRPITANQAQRRELVFMSAVWSSGQIGDAIEPPFGALMARRRDDLADGAPVHDRQMVILDRSDWSAWFEQTWNEADLLRALPAGSLDAEQVR
jgi:putative SOS response-associated peptidase YedK